jgi:hypothetical protein
MKWRQWERRNCDILPIVLLTYGIFQLRAFLFRLLNAIVRSEDELGYPFMLLLNAICPQEFTRRLGSAHLIFV